MSPTIAFFLLAVVMGVAYIYNLHPGAMAAYIGQTPAPLADAPDMIWSKDLELNPNEEIIDLNAGSGRILVVSRSEESGLHARWYDHSGYEAASITLEDLPPVWATAGDTLVVAYRPETENEWKLEFFSSHSLVGSPGEDDANDRSFGIEGSFSSLNFRPLGTDAVAVLAYGGPDNPTEEAVDQVFLYHRQQLNDEGVLPGIDRPGTWVRHWSVSYHDEAILQYAPGVSALAFTIFQATAAEPYRLEVRDHRGAKLWQRDVEAPGWIVSFTSPDTALANTDVVVWVRREQEIALLSESGTLWTVHLEGSVKDCRPMHHSAQQAACFVEDDSGSQLVMVNRVGHVLKQIPLSARRRWWYLYPSGLLLGEGPTVSAIDGTGVVRWSVELPFTAALAAQIDTGLVFAGGRTLALLERAK